MSLPYFPMYPTDFEADTSHLTLEEDGAYNRLLRLMWMTPGCSLPDDDSWVMRRMRVDQETFYRVIKPLIAEFFRKDKGRLFSPRLMREFNDLSETREKRSIAGKKGGHASKPMKTNETMPSRAKAGPKHARGIPEPEPDIATSSEDKSSSEAAAAQPQAREPEAIPKPSRRDLKALESQLREAAKLEHSPSRGLLVVGPILGLIDAGCDLEVDVLQTIRAVAARANYKPPSSWAYFVQAIQAAFAQRIGAAQQVAKPPDVDEAKWKARLEYARKCGTWPVAEWGPIPGSPGFMVPPALLIEGDGRGWHDRRAA